MADTFRLGKDAKVYRSTSGNYLAPTWVEIDIIKDVALKCDAGEWDGSRRGSGGWKQMARTMKSAEIDLDMVFVPNDAGYLAIRNAYIGGALLDLLVLTGSIAVDNNEGLRAEMTVLSLEREEKLEEGIMIKSKVKPGVSANAPVWVATLASAIIVI